MATTESIVGIASKFYEARSALRSLLTKSYAKHAVKWMATVDAVSQGEGQSHLQTAMKLIGYLQERGDDGMAQMWILAAVAELMEPDAQTPNHEEYENG